MINKISVLDIGARDGIGWPWNILMKDSVDVILVEPDPAEAKLLEDRRQGRVLPYALWSEETELQLNINNSPGTSSVFEPNMPFLQQFEDSQRFKAKDKITVQTKTVDRLAKNGEINTVDFVKIDVQGGELAILQGGEFFFRDNIIGLESEVEFTPMYKDQPLFSDIDIFAREKLGLELWDIRKTYWKYKKRRSNPHTPVKGRLIFGDALYLRPISSLDEWLSGMEKEIATSKVHALITASIVYGFLDYAFVVVNSSFSRKYLTEEDKKVLIGRIDVASKGFYPFKNGNRFLHRILDFLTYSFKPLYKGWGYGEPHLGSKKKGIFWF